MDNRGEPSGPPFPADWRDWSDGYERVVVELDLSCEPSAAAASLTLAWQTPCRLTYYVSAAKAKVEPRGTVIGKTAYSLPLIVNIGRAHRVLAT
jgi:hypothetical protein